jgi:tetratricopeptide (TPR) repeat protein
VAALRGAIALHREHWTDAAGHLRRAAAALPADPGVLTNLGIALGRTGDSAEAEAVLRRALAARPDFAPALFNLGVLLRDAGRPEDAAAALRSAVAAEPGYAKAQAGLAGLLLERGDAAGALAASEAALAAGDDDPGTRRTAGAAAQALCRFEAAAAHYRRCLARRPGDADAGLGLGTCLQELGEVDAALEVYRGLLAADRRLYAAVVRSLTSASHGRLWLSPAALRRALLG